MSRSKSTRIALNAPSIPPKKSEASAKRTAHITSVIPSVSLPVYVVLSSPISTAEETSQQSIQRTYNIAEVSSALLLKQEPKGSAGFMAKPCRQNRQPMSNSDVSQFLV